MLVPGEKSNGGVFQPSRERIKRDRFEWVIRRSNFHAALLAAGRLNVSQGQSYELVAGLPLPSPPSPEAEA